MLEEHTFDTGVVSINYAEGPPSGSPLVLLHGGAGSWRSFLAVIPHLVPDWYIYAPDFRGHGRYPPAFIFVLHHTNSADTGPTNTNNLP